MSKSDKWLDFQQWDLQQEGVPLSLNFAASGLKADSLGAQQSLVEKALGELSQLESGEKVNTDEGRMVGHYWLRAPDLSPTSEISDAITSAQTAIAAFAEGVASGSIKGSGGAKFTKGLLVGIGGSALGPQLLADCFSPERELFFVDNTDAAGISRTLEKIGDLSDLLVFVISKSGGTVETRNGMVLVQEAFARGGVPFEAHAVAITQEGSKLDKLAESTNWLARFPIWDWVGGRTSLLSPVGLVPAAFSGIDTAELLQGAALMDRWTREKEASQNPALLLALSWVNAAAQGKHNFVVLPYADRLQLMSRYLQQLIMESVGKRVSRAGDTVEEGVSVFGNKGSTDQHAFVQQLRDGRNDFLACFIEVLKDEDTFFHTHEIEEGFVAGDYLSGFLNGTQSALSESDRLNCTISLEAVSEQSVGALIALFERAVSFYASFVDINAYHQPGVEAGKKAATITLECQQALVTALRDSNAKMTISELHQVLQGKYEERTIFHICRRLAANGRLTVEMAATLGEWKFACDA